MFEPTIKYKRVNDLSPEKKDLSNLLEKLDIANGGENDSSANKNKPTQKLPEKKEPPANENSQPEKTKIDDTVPIIVKEDVSTKQEFDFTFEEEEEDDCKIEVDPQDKERIIVTLSTGKQFSADRYCPHAGADLSYHGKVSEHDYPPEIGPVLMCPIHYWEFALEKGGKGGGGWATINACPVEVAEKCAASSEKKKLDW